MVVVLVALLVDCSGVSIVDFEQCDWVRTTLSGTFKVINFIFVNFQYFQ